MRIVMDKLRRVDWTVLIILGMFMAISTLIIRSAVADYPKLAGYDFRQLFYYVLGFGVLGVSSLLNYRLLIKAAPYLYGAGVLLLIAVYFFGQEINQARGWFELPGIGMSVQPAELQKLFLILIVAYILARRAGEPLQLIRDVFLTVAVVAVSFVLVIIQPDLGNAMIYIIILLGMLWIANIKFLHVLAGTAVAASIIAGILFLVTSYHDQVEQFLEDHGSGHWMDRIDAFLTPQSADTYHLDNSLSAIASGALFGEGYMNGDSVHNRFIPYTYSDSIFVVVGEEFGFMGSSALLLLYFLLIYRLILISIQTPDKSGSYIIIGIVSMFVFQIFQNIGMFLELLPLTGITLPFVSYGGSSLLINMLSIGLAISIRIHGEEPLEE
ncbi:FtsW/RodA/SpoVE family cell cycle protein [Paenibacillus alkalitolerans]|uniref:FtsW/RodA/SpoVE family cell cycle protein n=1 Tax=Paenibacillus alkalitolerans TaxID=2799335 RepID=UPI0018F350AD|nr:FtsW/RodA/SpoVE family cell cycle protein [Paenibacillus alkalitolerans]